MVRQEIEIIILVALFLIIIIFLFVRIALRLRKYGGSMTTIMHASTYEILGKERRASVKEIVETKANKKMEEDSSDKTGLPPIGRHPK